MALPTILDPAVPPGSESPKNGDNRIRGLKQQIADIFGVPTGVSITAAAFTITAGGLVTVKQGPTGIELTNKTGGTLIAGDVVAINTANDSAVALSDILGSLARFVVALTTISDGAVGGFALTGIVSAKVQGAVNRGRYLRKSATSKAFEDTGILEASATSAPLDAVALALEPNASGSAVKKVLLLPAPPQLLVLTASGTSVATDDATLKTLKSVTLPANALNKAGKGLLVEAWGRMPNNNTNSREVRLDLGGTAVMRFAETPGSAQRFYWYVRSLIVRKGTNDQRVVSVYHGTGNVASGEVLVEAAPPAARTVSGDARTSEQYVDAAANETTALALELKGKSNAATANDVIVDGWCVTWVDANQ